MDARTATRIAELVGKEGVAQELMPLVYEELKALAQAQFMRERAGHTLEPTALVHEAYLRLADLTQIDWKGRTHFLAVGAIQMRRVLVDHARRRDAAKRGGAMQRVTLHDEAANDIGADADVLALDEALEALGEADARQARIVELRVFGGLTNDEAAAIVGVSPRTAAGDWRMAKAWLKRALSDGGER